MFEIQIIPSVHTTKIVIMNTETKDKAIANVDLPANSLNKLDLKAILSALEAHLTR